MIHYPYTNNKENNLHLQYLITATYMLGMRNPSETAILKTTDVNLEDGLVTIIEPKKNNSTREIMASQQYMTGRNCNSMRNWIEHIRPRYTTRKSEDYLFITLTGNPFTRDYLRKYLIKNIKPHFKEYQPYLPRHWAATARHVQEYRESKC